MSKNKHNHHKLIYALVLIIIGILSFTGGFFTGRAYEAKQGSPTITQPTPAPTLSPVIPPAATKLPVPSGTAVPTSPTKAPTTAPTKGPTIAPTKAPTITPTKAPTKTPTIAPTTTPTKAPDTTSCALRVSTHGQLKVNGTQLCDESDAPVVLRGISTAGIAWFPDFATKAFMQTFRDEWNISVFRIAMYSYEGNNSYVNNPSWNQKKVCELIDAAIELDLYVIVDWHILADGNPQTYQTQAIEFFTYISEKYAGIPNILYEICNEPNGNVSWSSNVKPYAEAVIPVIRAASPNAVILVGSPTWSQDVDIAANDPLDFENIMYSLHFYAGTHREWLRSKATTAMKKGLALFVTEWGTTDASGDGNVDTASSDEWLTFLEKHGISWCNWSLCNKAEASALLLPSASTNGALPDSALSASGKYIKKKLAEYAGEAPAVTPVPNPDNPQASDDSVAPSASPAPTKTPTQPPTDTDSLRLLAYNENRDLQTGTIGPRIQIQNHSSHDIALDTLQICYYYTPESAVAQKLWCDYADINGSGYQAITDLVTGSYDTKKGGMTIRFSSGILPSGDTLSLQLRITNEDWSNYDQSNDASFLKNASSYTENPSISLFME